MDTNPYAPPTAVVADRAPVGLKHRSIVLMIVLFVVSLGLYYIVWFFRRRAAINQLNSPRKLRLWPLLAYSAFYVVALVQGAVLAAGGSGQILGASTDIVMTVTQWVVVITMIVQGFIVKDIIEDHLDRPEAREPLSGVQRVQLSGLMTFFFSIFYLQHKINKHIAGNQNAV